MSLSLFDRVQLRAALLALSVLLIACATSQRPAPSVPAVSSASALDSAAYRVVIDSLQRRDRPGPLSTLWSPAAPSALARTTLYCNGRDHSPGKLGRSYDAGQAEYDLCATTVQHNDTWSSF